MVNYCVCGRTCFRFGVSHDAACLVLADLPWMMAIRLALAADTLSILIMKIVDNAVMLLIPGAMDIPPAHPAFWLYMFISLGLTGVATFPVNRWLIARGRGHAVVHQHLADTGSHHSNHAA